MTAFATFCVRWTGKMLRVGGELSRHPGQATLEAPFWTLLASLSMLSNTVAGRPSEGGSTNLKKRCLAGCFWLAANLLLMVAGSLANGHSHTEQLPEACGLYDVIVLGSEPEAVSAAVAAAESGAATLLVTTDETVGGLFVLGQMNVLDLRTQPFDYQLGLFERWWQLVGGGHAFDVT